MQQYYLTKQHHMFSSYRSTVRALLFLTAFCLALETFRLISAGTLNFIFLPFNLLLAWIPLGLALLTAKQPATIKMLLLSGAWLLFFPNAPYITTDLLHLKPRYDFPFWYDTLMLYAFALCGFMLGIFSLLIIYKRWRQTFSHLQARLVLLVAMVLSGYGIYMGRYLRWNSWDAFLNPLQIIGDTAQRLLHPTMYPRAYGVTALSAILIWLVFKVIESLLPAEPNSANQ